VRILVTFAVKAEFAPWRRLRRFQKAQVAHLGGYTTEIASAKVVVVLTGVGPGAATGKLEGIWRGEDFDVCISSGLAGALRANHLPGEILAARRVVSERGARAVGGDEELLSLAASCGAKIVACFCTSERILLTASEKSRLGSQADAVEMESREVLEGAAARDIRGIAVRAIADGVDEDLPLDFNRVVTPVGEVSFLRVIGEAAKKPGSLPGLARFGRQGRWAGEQLAGFLERYVAVVGQQIGRGARTIQAASR
jgi:nucleoside phosphorylase